MKYHNFYIYFILGNNFNFNNMLSNIYNPSFYSIIFNKKPKLHNIIIGILTLSYKM